MENARLITEQREALEQQTATAEVLQVINASPGDLAPVFDAILEKAHAAVRGGDRASLTTYDGEHLQRRGDARGSCRIRRVSERQRPHRPDRRTVDASSDGERRRSTSVDVEAVERYRTGDQLHACRSRSRGHTHRCWSCRCARTRRLLGYIALYRQEVRPFSDKQIALLENFAAQAVIAMENARLLTEQREALEQQTATAEVLQVINASPGNLAPVFDAMLEKAMRLCEAAFGSLYTYDGERFSRGRNCGRARGFAEFMAQTPLIARTWQSAATRSIETDDPSRSSI